MEIYSLRLDKNRLEILAQLADNRQATRAEVVRWLITEAGRVFLGIEPEKEGNDVSLFPLEL